MSHSWNHWACIVDENIEKKNKDIEELQMQYSALLDRLVRVETVNERLKRKAEWLCEKEKKKEKKRKKESDQLDTKMPRVESEGSYTVSSMMSFSARRLRDAGGGSSKPCATIVELHGGYIEPKPLAIATPIHDPTSRMKAMMYPKAPTPSHDQSRQMCVRKGWHTNNFNEWMLHSQMNVGTSFERKDLNSAISHYIQRLGTFTLPVG